MKLKMIIAYLIGTALMVHAGFCAETPARKNNRIGYLSASAINDTFRQALRDLGYIEGQNLVFEYRQAETTEQYSALAEELVHLKVDLIFAVGVAAVRESRKATHTIPIVMGNSSADPVRLGLIKSLARPGGNVTGVFDFLPNLAGKRIALLKELYPKLSRVAHIAPNSPGRNTVGPAHLEATVAAARSIGIAVQDVKVARPEDLEGTFRMLADGGTEAAVLVGVSFFIPHRDRITQLAAKYLYASKVGIFGRFHCIHDGFRRALSSRR
jgi:putative ABC transport system substrate-binding protein